MSRQSHYLCEIVSRTAQAGSNNVSEVKISSLMAALSICAVPENGRGSEYTKGAERLLRLTNDLSKQKTPTHFHN